MEQVPSFPSKEGILVAPCKFHPSEGFFKALLMECNFNKGF